MKIPVNSKPLLVAILLVLFTGLVGNEAVAISEAKLTASDAASQDQFGYSVSISGDTVVVGAKWNDDAGNDSGSAYVFRYNGSSWVEETKLTASDAAAWDNFGQAVSISGDTVVVGAPWDDDSGNASGSAYVFRYNGSSWVEEAKLIATDGAADDWFGSSVSISGDIVVVGAQHDSDAGNFSGSAYVFRYNGSSWVEETKLTGSDAAEPDYSGVSVSISGDTVVLGASYNDDAGTDSGSAYVFRYNGSSWVEEDKLTASDAAADDQFGYSVSINGDTVVVGAPWDDDTHSNSGSAYVFRYNGSSWVEEAKLTASDSISILWFGYSVSIAGESLVVGAPGTGPSTSGSAYVFKLAAKNTLTIQVSGNGSTIPTPGTHAYDSDTEVEVTATPAPGWIFTGWSGDLTASTNPVTVEMDSDKSITANFTFSNSGTMPGIPLLLLED